jgi:hypothetical protein
VALISTAIGAGTYFVLQSGSATRLLRERIMRGLRNRGRLCSIFSLAQAAPAFRPI